ncbi:unnamed protein product [Rhodiola kirilowii]
MSVTERIKRYWPGKGADDVDEDNDMARFVLGLDKAFTIDGDKDDPRLRRWLENRLLDDKDTVRADHRRMRQAEIIVSEEIQRLDEKEDDEDLDEKRRAIKEKMLRKTVVFPEEEFAEDVYGYETESDEDMTGIAMVKPFFFPKSEKDTVAERERLKAEERAFKEMMVKKRKEETKKIVVELIRKDEEIQRNMDVEVSNIAAADEAKEYEAWKAREIDRVKRDRDAMVKEREEIDKVRKMTEEERKQWERKNPKPTPPSKKKLRFMQKDYHKGAFFQDDPDSIFTRDFSEPTGEDKMDKSLLPKIMQVKQFGHSGRTKWTHLVNEDTSLCSMAFRENIAITAVYSLPQFQQAHQLFQRYAQTITPEALEGVKAALASSESQHKAETKKKAVPRKAAGQTWEDPTLAEWPENDYRLFCGDLGNEVNDDVLTKAFSRFPSFKMAKVVRDKRTGKTKGYGFISFANVSNLAAALKEMNGKYVGNRLIKLRKSNWKERIDFDALERQKNYTPRKPKNPKKSVLHK